MSIVKDIIIKDIIPIASVVIPLIPKFIDGIGKLIGKGENEEINNKYEKLYKEFQENKEMLEKLRKEHENERNKIEERKNEAISRCKESLENILSKGIKDITNHFNEEENKWFQCLKNDKNQKIFNDLKQETIQLFDEIFKSQGITKKITDEFIKASKMFLNNIELRKMNFMVYWFQWSWEKYINKPIIWRKIRR